MSPTITADVVEGQIDTASGLLRWIEAEADKTRRAISVTPLLYLLAYILGSIVKKVENEGIENFDPLHAGYASSKLREVHEAIHMMISRSQHAGLYSRFPCSVAFTRIEGQRKHLEKIASALYLIDEKWQSTVSEAASGKIAIARKMAVANPDGLIDLFDTSDEPSNSPSENAIRSQFRRAATLDKH